MTPLANEETNLPPADDALILVHLRNEFYRKKYRFTLGVYLLSIIVIIFLISLLAYILKHPVRPMYFVADSVGRLIQDVPVTQPNMTTDEAMAWAIEAVEKVNSYDFVNYRQQLQDAEKYFLPFSWKQYLNGLTASNNLLALKQRQMVFVGKVIEKPTLVVADMLGGAFAYKFKMKILVTYLLPPNYSEANAFRNPYEVTIVMQRQRLLQSYRGLAIVQLIVKSPTDAAPAILAVPT